MANPQIKNVRLRMAFDISNWMPSSVTEIISGKAPLMATGANHSLELMFSYGALADTPASTVLDLSVYTSIVVALQSSPVPHEGTTYWYQTIPYANLYDTVTAAQWIAAQPNSTAQAIVSIPYGIWQTVAIGASTSYWLCIYAITSDSPAQYVPLASFVISVFDTGMPVGNVVTSPTLIGTQSFLCADSKYRKLSIVQNPDGIWVLTVVSQTGTSSP